MVIHSLFGGWLNRNGIDMTKERFFEMIEKGEARYLTLADLRLAFTLGWIDEDRAEGLASIILDC